MCKYLPKVHLHTKSYQDRFKNKKVFSCVPHLLWKWPWSNGVWKMNLLEAGGCNFWARIMIFGYVVAQFIVLKSYYWNFLTWLFLYPLDGLKGEEFVPPYCVWLYFLPAGLKLLWNIKSWGSRKTVVYDAYWNWLLEAHYTPWVSVGQWFRHHSPGKLGIFPK